MSRELTSEEVHFVGREMSVRSVMFHSAVADRLGLSVSDLRAWDLLANTGSMTAGELANLTGLSPGAVTGLIDRLVRAGAVRRSVNPHDRRKVTIRVISNLRTGKGAKYYASVQKAIAELYRRYSQSELTVINGYTKDMTELLRTEMMRLCALHPLPRHSSTLDKGQGWASRSGAIERRSAAGQDFD